MELIFQSNQNHTNLMVFKNTLSINELKNKTQLTTQEKSKLDLLKSEKRKKEWLGIRFAIQKKFGNDVEIKYKGKKPFIDKKKYFSISHSGNLLAFFSSNKYSIGIDIEKISNKIESFLYKFIHDQEKIFLTNDNHLLATHLIWCAKEAIYKSYGLGGLIFNKEMIISNINYKKNTAQGFLIKNKITENYSIHFKKLDSYLLVFAIKT